MIRNVFTDTFARTVSNGWGTADTGQAWSTFGAGGTIAASDYNVAAGFGTQSVPAVASFRVCYLPTVSLADVDVAVTVKLNRNPVVGGPIEIGNLLVRGETISTYYLFRLQVEVGGTLTALIFAPGGTQLASTTVPGLTYTGTSQLIRVRAQAVGSALRMRVWDTAGSEPVRWLLAVDDSTYTGSGWVGVRTGVASANTNTLPVVASYDNFTAGTPFTTDFPDEDLEIHVYAAFGADLSADPYTWPYTEITADMLDNPIQLKNGRSDGATQPEAATFSCTLDNPDGRYTRGNPMSARWPNVQRNVPILCAIQPDTSQRPVQFDGYAVGWAPAWSKWTRQASVALSAAGILQRLKQGAHRAQSSLFRALTRSAPVAYWALEEGQATTEAASGLIGGAPIVGASDPTGILDASVLPQWGQGNLASWLTSTVSLSNGSNMRATAPAIPATSWAIDHVINMGTGRGNNIDPIILVYVTGAGLFPTIDWDIELQPAGAVTQDTLYVTWFATNADGTGDANQFTITPSFPIFDGQPHYLRLVVAQNGANIEWALWVDGVEFSGVQTSSTLQPPGPIEFNPQFVTPPGEWAVGHLSVWASSIPALSAADAYQAMVGYAGETVTDRLVRISAEEGIPLALTGTSGMRMGPQGVATFLTWAQECEDADGGVLFDGLTPGVGYVARTARENLPIAMLINYSTMKVSGATTDDQVFVPVDDDQQVRNRWTATRVNGGSDTYEGTDGPQGTAAVGVYESSVSLNLADDSTLHAQASWRVHLGTVDGLRFPSLPLDFTANPDLLGQWLGLDLMGRVSPFGLPSQYPQQALNLALAGRQQTISRRALTATANCTPNDPWRIGVVAQATGDVGEFVERLETDGTTIGAAAAVGATSLSLLTVAGPHWTMNSDDFPLNLNTDGINVTVTNITRSVTDVFGRTTSSGWGTADTGQSWTTSGGSASDYSVSSGTARQSNGTVNVLRTAVLDIGSNSCDFTADVSVPLGSATGASVTQWVCGRLTDLNNFYCARLDLSTTGSVVLLLVKRVAGALTTLGTVTVASTHTSGDLWRVRLYCVGSLIQAQASLAASASEASGWQITASDTDLTSGTQIGLLSRLETGNTNTTPVVVSWDNLTLLSPQLATVTGTTVTKALSAGAPVTVWEPPYLGM